MASSASTLEPDQKTNEKMTQQEESDETDSCFEFIKRRNRQIVAFQAVVYRQDCRELEKTPGEPTAAAAAAQVDRHSKGDSGRSFQSRWRCT